MNFKPSLPVVAMRGIDRMRGFDLSPFFNLGAWLVFTFHAGLVTFMIGFVIYTILGYHFDLPLTKSLWLRGAHLGVFFYIGLESLMGWPCPFTVWENELRLRAGRQPYSANGCFDEWTQALIGRQCTSRGFAIAISFVIVLCLISWVFFPPTWSF